ncbi:MAG: GDSL-type esterase/lipase family protein, partial [Bacillota bacterium]
MIDIKKPQDFKRFGDFIEKLESYPHTEEQVILYGSSFFTEWKYEIVRDNLSWDKFSVINHGFGGALVDDLLYYYGRLVKPYKPKAVVIRAGVNDIASGYDPKDVINLLYRLCAWCEADFPEVKIVLLPIFDVPKPEFENCRKGFAEFNRMCYEIAEQISRILVMDINDLFYKNPADVGTYQNFKDIFRNDGLHLTEHGYDEIGPRIK